MLIVTRAVIPAPPQAVYAVLADFAGYARWNPLNVEGAGDAAPGARAPMTVVNPLDGRRVAMTMTVTRAEPGRALEWLGETPVLFRGRHFFHLAPDPSGTRLEHGEELTGLVPAWIGAKKINALWPPAYEAVNAALAREAVQRLGAVAAQP